MKKLAISISLSLFCTALPALAHSSSMFKEITDNKRVERIIYADDKVVRLGAIIDHPFFIELKEDEPIENVAGGKIAGWEVHKKEHRLFIRATKEAKQTTLLVTAGTHSYVFDLIPKKSISKNFDQRRSKIIFEYPQAFSMTMSEIPTIPEVKVAEPSLPAKVENSLSVEPNAYRNENYTMQIVQETIDIRPREVFDNGRFTWFKFPRNVEIPAIYKSVPNTQDEVLVNSHLEGDYVVLHAIAPLWNLRLDQSMLGIFNESYDAEGVATPNNTTQPGLFREGKQ